MIKWTFVDPTDSSTVEFEVNPKAGGSLSSTKNVTSHSTLAVGGKTLLFEGNQSVQEITFSGIVNTETAFNDMIDMFAKRHQIQMNDDLGRSFMILITKFVPKRVRARRSPWKHSYDVTATIVDWP